MTTPTELFHEWLGKRPPDARVAVAIDSDRFLADSAVLDKPSLVDPTGRHWALVVFRGDDLTFRLRFRKAASKTRTAIVLTRGADSNQPIDVSHVADILARNEAGEPLDLSVIAFFRRIIPKINCPGAELRRFKTDLLARLDFVQDAANKLIQRWGKPDSWGRGQVAAMVLLAHHSGLNLEDIWTDEIEPAEFLARCIRLLVGRPELHPHREIVLQIIREAAREQVSHLLYWTEIEPSELAAYLVLRDLAGRANLQNPSTQLGGIQLFSADLPMSELENLAVRVIAVLKRAGVWPTIEQRAEFFITPSRAAKVVSLLPPLTGGHEDAENLLAQTTPAVLRQQLLLALKGFLAKPTAQGLAWSQGLSKHPFLAKAGDSTEQASHCRAGLRLFLALQRLETVISAALPEFPHADSLLDWYVQTGHHLLELDVSLANHFLAEFGDAELIQRGQRYLFGDDEQRPSPESLKGRVAARLEALDRALADFVQPDPAGFCRGARNVRGLLRAKIDVKQIAADTLPGRVWVLIFDGMRLDTWEKVVRPLLANDFIIDDQPCYGLLPTYTEVARTGLLAGGMPSEWKAPNGKPSRDETQLFAANMGLAAHEISSKVRYVTGADTTMARRKLGFTDEGVRLLNVLIYPVSDEEAHDFDGDLASLNNVIRTKIVGDNIAGVRGILDDLLKRIHPNDVVVLSSDHGFKELLRGDEVPVSGAEAAEKGRSLEESVRWRFVEGFSPTAMTEAVRLPTGVQDVWMAVGRRWFKREGTKSVPRYSHGGLSLSEAVVPGAVLRRAMEKSAMAELVDLPTVIEAEEDVTVQVPFRVRNSGNAEIEFEARVINNLGEECFTHRAQLAPATAVKLVASVLARYQETPAREPDPAGTVSAVTLILRHTDLNGVLRDALDGRISIPVKIEPRPVKFDTDALKGFDDV